MSFDAATAEPLVAQSEGFDPETAEPLRDDKFDPSTAEIVRAPKPAAKKQVYDIGEEAPGMQPGEAAAMKDLNRGMRTEGSFIEKAIEPAYRGAMTGVKLPDVPKDLPDVTALSIPAPLPGVPASLDVSLPVVGGIAQGAKGAIESLTAPIMLALGPLGEGGAIGRTILKGVEAYFAGDMAGETGKKTAQFIELVKDPKATKQEIAQAGTELATDAAFTTAVSTHLASGKVVPEDKGPSATDVGGDERAPNFHPLGPPEPPPVFDPATAKPVTAAEPIVEEKPAANVAPEPVDQELVNARAEADRLKAEGVDAALKDPDTKFQYNVWDRAGLPEGRSRVLQIDLPSPNAPEAAGTRNYGSVSPELLRERGVDIPEPPESLPPGRYTREEIQAAIDAEKVKKETPPEIAGANEAFNLAADEHRDAPPPEDAGEPNVDLVPPEQVREHTPTDMAPVEGKAPAAEAADDPFGPSTPEEKPAKSEPVRMSPEDRARMREEEQSQLDQPGPELLDVVRGKLPHPSMEKALRGELQSIWDNLVTERRVPARMASIDKAGNKISARKAFTQKDTSAAMRFFGKKGKEGAKAQLDGFREYVNEHGFNFETPADLLTAIEASQRGEKLYGQPVDRSQMQPNGEMPVAKPIRGKAVPAKPTVGSKVLDVMGKRADAARERIAARLEKKFTLGVVEGPEGKGLFSKENIADMAEIGAYHLARGVIKSAEWTKAMIDEFGEKVRPYLPEIFTESQRYHNAIKNGDDLPPNFPAKETEREPLPQGVTATKNAQVDAEREARGLAPAMSAAARDFGEVWDQAMRRVDENPKAGEMLVKELKDKPRAISDVENAVLLHRQIELQNEFERVTQRINKGGGSVDEIESDQIRHALLSDDLLDIYNVGRAVGTETGRGLNARKMLATEDFSLANMVTQRRAARGGRELSADEMAETQQLHEKIAKLQKSFDDYRAKAEAEAPVKRQRAVFKRFSEALKPKAEAAMERIAQRLEKKLTLGAVEGPEGSGLLSAEMLSDVADVAAYHLARGADWAVELAKTLGEKVVAKNREAIEARLEQLRDKLQAKANDEELTDSKIDAYIKARKARLETDIAALDKKIKEGDTSVTPPKANRPLIPELEGLQQEREQLSAELAGMREHERKIAELEDAIAEKNRKIKEGDLSAKETAKSRPAVEEVEKLKQKRDALNEKISELRKEKRQEGSEERRLAGEVERLEKAIEEKKAKLNSGDLSAKPRNANRPAVESVEKLKQERDALNKQLTEARAANRAKAVAKDSRLQAFKTRTGRKIEELTSKTERGDFSTKGRPKHLALDEEGWKLKADLDRAKQSYQEALLKDRLANRTRWEKAQDVLVKWRRGFLLSNPVTLAKLTAAAVQRYAFTPIEEAVGGVIGKLVPGIAERAPREGGFNVDAEAKAITDGMTKGMQDAYDLIKTGKSQLEVLFGKGKDGAVRESDVTPRSVIDLFGQIHGALKSPVKRAEFARSMEKRIAHAIRSGMDVTDPMVQMRLSVDAYKDANRSIFLNDNVVVNAYNRAVASLMEKQRSTGKPSGGGRIIATATKVLLPIVRVPTNIVAETIQYATGTVTGSLRVANALRRGVETLDPEQADLIMRELKKGSLGAAALLIGYFNADNIGGYYQQGDGPKRKDDKHPNFGSMRIAGLEIPSYLLHNPLLETVQIGATIRRVAESKLKKGDKETQGLGSGIWAAALGLLEEVPFIRQQIETGKMLEPKRGGYARRNFVKSLVVPAAVDFAARQTDRDKNGEPVRRQAQTYGETIQSGIPGLRESLPVAGDKKRTLKSPQSYRTPREPR